MEGGAPEPRAGVLRVHGVRFPKDTALLPPGIRRTIRDETYEARELRAALKLVRPGDRVLELGAGIGYVSAILARKRRPAHIYAFEANPHLVPYIRSVYAENGLAHASVHNAVMAPEPGGPVPFHLRRSFLASSLDPGTDPAAVTETVHVERLCFADALADLRPDVLICDIEGAEATLLPAADLSGLRAAVLELHPDVTGQAGVQAVFDAMTRAGLTYFAPGSERAVVAFARAG